MSRCICISVITGVLVVVFIVVGVALGLTLGKNSSKKFKSTFMKNCEKHNGYDCQNIWEAFSQAYVGRNSCNVPMEAYDLLMAAAPIQPMYNRALFWSETKKFVRDFTAKTNTTILEDTLLGSLLNDQTWCGKEGSDETLTSGCPDWSQCENSPVRSFWKRASAAFAEAAHDDVTALLNGDSDNPFKPTSVFGSIEIKRLKHPRVKSMKVVLVSKNKPSTNCSNASLNDLKKELDAGINYSCSQSNGHKYFASVLVYLLLMGQVFL